MAEWHGTYRFLSFLDVPEVGQDAHAALLHRNHGWVLIRIGEVLGNVLYHELLGIVFEVGAHEAILQRGLGQFKSQLEVKISLAAASWLHEPVASSVGIYLAKFRFGFPSRSSSSRIIE